ncbi:MAG: PIN domain-containing protein [Thermomicrobiales bacterium]|nr:PIN domain-containing protein [Thermomicrobiales bacterium]
MLDTNILIYHLTSNDPNHSPASQSLMLRVRIGEEHVYCPSTAILEATYILNRQMGYTRRQITPALGDVLMLENVHCECKIALLKGLVFWEQQSPLDFADCYHLALAKELGMMQVYSFDKKMDRYPGVERIEPE